MKLSELKQIIRECIDEIAINEKAPRRATVVEPGQWEKHYGSRYTRRANTLAKDKPTTVDKTVNKSGKRKGMLTKKSQNSLKSKLTYDGNARYASKNSLSYYDEPYMTPSGKEKIYRPKSSYKKSGVGK